MRLHSCVYCIQLTQNLRIDVAKGEKDYDPAGGAPAQAHKIRITLTSRKVKNLEKGASCSLCVHGRMLREDEDTVCTDLVNRAKDKDLRVKGPVRLPTKVSSIILGFQRYADGPFSL